MPSSEPRSRDSLSAIAPWEHAGSLLVSSRAELLDFHFPIFMTPDFLAPETGPICFRSAQDEYPETQSVLGQWGDLNHKLIGDSRVRRTGATEGGEVFPSPPIFSVSSPGFDQFQWIKSPVSRRPGEQQGEMTPPEIVLD